MVADTIAAIHSTSRSPIISVGWLDLMLTEDSRSTMNAVAAWALPTDVRWLVDVTNLFETFPCPRGLCALMIARH